MALYVVGKNFWGDPNGAGTPKGKSSETVDGMGPAGGSVPEQRAAGKRMVRRRRYSGIHVL